MGKANHMAKFHLNNGNPKCPKAYGNPTEGAATRLAYIAGFFDGEGTITIARNARGNKPYYHRISVSVTSTDLEVLQLIQKWFPEGKIIEAHDKRAKVHYRAAYRYQITGPRAYRMLVLLRPYLVLKRRQAALAIGFYWLFFKKKPLMAPTNGVPQRISDQRNKFYWKMRELNRSIGLGRPRTTGRD